MKHYIVLNDDQLSYLYEKYKVTNIKQLKEVILKC